VSIKLGVVGGGVMAEAIVSRLLQEDFYQPDQVLISEPGESRRQFWQDTYGVMVTNNNQQVFDDCELLLLAIKPQILDIVAQEINCSSWVNPPALIVSILAGVVLERLEAVFPALGIVRVMPNTPALVGQGMTAITANPRVGANELGVVRSIFDCVGEVIEVPEYMMDGVTGLSGSGPAFVALMTEALADGGVAVGLPRAIASQLALQTVLGTAELMKQKQLHPAMLKDQVTSPGGTTIAGVAQLEKQGFRSAVIEAVKAAKMRSQELNS